MNSSRRSFLKVSGACTMGFLGLRSLTGKGLSKPLPKPKAPAGYGDLQPDPEGVIELPAGFTYRILSEVGELM
ncbi:MAG: phosphatase, partial [Acidobacteriota bacterium]|nr:phosphatase [Acidobacteriota bacterium]